MLHVVDTRLTTFETFWNARLKEAERWCAAESENPINVECLW